MTAPDWEQLLEEQLRKLGTRSPVCAVDGCDQTNPFALTGTHPRILCYEHQAELNNRPWLEAHHPMGRANDPETLLLPGNDHRVLSARQRQWPQETLRNPDGSPLLKAAAALRGWLDVLWLIITVTLGWVPDLLEQLDAWLRAVLGDRWWDGFNWRRD